jgi:hypothetical protein
LGGSKQQLAPAGALLITERELVVIAEEKAFAAESPEAPSAVEPKQISGGIITFVPRVRLKGFHVSHQEGFGVLTLQVRAEHVGQNLEINFPSDDEKAVSKAMEQMLLSRGSAK